MTTKNSFLFALALLTSCVSCDRRYKGDSNPRYKKLDRTERTNTETNPAIENNLENNDRKSVDNNNEDLTSLFRRLEKSVFQVFNVDEDGNGSSGSGFLIGESIGITNYHVLESSYEFYFVMIQGNIYEIEELIEYSPTERLDYAIFRIENFKGTPLKIAANRPQIAEEVFAIGSPKGLENSFTKGVVSQYRDNSRIQIDATIDSGSSGGPLFNLKGEVIGITTSSLADTNRDLNFAVDIQALDLNKF